MATYGKLYSQRDIYTIGRKISVTVSGIDTSFPLKRKKTKRKKEKKKHVY